MRTLAFFLLLLPAISSAQFLYEIDQSIPITGAGNLALKYPWTGGLNAPQINTMDLNGDAIDDLVLFDRMGDLVLTFLRQENQYAYAPQYEILFPEEITNWLLLRDFNADGHKDIFTGDALGIKVYVNKTESDGALTWKPFLFFSGTSKNPLLLTKISASPKAVMQISYDDLPSISDADGDGDLDIFIMHFQESTIEYHRNYSYERGHDYDSLDFERITTSWGGVRECGCGEVAFNNESCSTSGRQMHAGGKSLFALDVDQDDDIDILFTEAECDQLYWFENTSGISEPANAVISSASPYPGTFSMINYPSPYVEDLDFDGIKDLIITPNVFTREFDETNFKESVWFYKNTGTNESPAYETADQNFLQADMIDVGDNAVPAFFDVDNDGDQDMFIGCYINHEYEAASVYFFENTGSATEPEFTFVTDDYRTLHNLNFINIKPTFSDMNGDNKIDFAFTAQTGSTTKLYYIENTGTSEADFSGSISPALHTLLWREENIALADVNQDGRPDLIIGKLNGALDYWRNTGTASAPSFMLEQANYLNLSSTVLRQNPSVATGDLDNDGKHDLLYGDQTGRITIISNYRGAGNASQSKTEIIYNDIVDQYTAQNLGGRIWPTIANLYGSPKPEIITGNILGGLHVIKNRFPDSLPEGQSPVIKFYPNPVSSSQQFTVEIDQTAEFQIFNILGQPVCKAVTLQAAELYYPTVAHLKGVYVLRFKVRGKSYARKIVIR